MPDIPSLVPALLIAGLASLLFCRLAIWICAAPWMAGRRDDQGKVQTAHSGHVGRVGGVCLVLAAALATAVLPDPAARVLASALFLSVAPVFLAGLAEDLGYFASPRRRLLAAALSSGLAIVLSGMWIRASGLPILDAALHFWPFALFLTLLWTTGMCHSVNLIDGVNGLSGSFALLAALGLAAIAQGQGDATMASVALTLVPAILGFLAFNWPNGRIFMGDAGAYSLGHLLSWIGLAIAWRNPEVAGAAIVLVFFWPICDTLFAIYRRRLKGQRVDQPDRMHIHQLVMRWLEIGGLGRARRRLSNPLTTLVLAPFMALPILCAVFVAASGPIALLCFAIFSTGFVLCYGVSMSLAKARRNPVDLFRSTAARPVSAPKAMALCPDHGEWVNDRLVLLRPRTAAYWNAIVRYRDGTWYRLDRRFSGRDRAIRFATREVFRDRFGLSTRHLGPQRPSPTALEDVAR